MSLASVRARIAAACARSGRSPDEVRLVAVTKGHDAEEVRARILAHGVRDLGENRAQEWRGKAEALPDDVRWHFVGNLQRNKVKYLADRRVTLVHSLASARLAEEMSRQGARRGHAFRALVEVNVAGEASKQGLAPEEVEPLLARCAELDAVEVAGLMTMAPRARDPEATRPVFARLRELRDRLGLRELSMGMSRDFEVAIEEGATLVRVGTALFEDEAPDDAPSRGEPPAAAEGRTP